MRRTDGRGKGRGAEGRARVKKGRWVGIHAGIVQPTDVNENKELLPSSDFLSPLSRRSGWSRHVQSRKHSARNGKRIRRNSGGGGGCEKGRREREKKGERTRDFRGVYSGAPVDARRTARLQRRAIISLPRNESFVKAEHAAPRSPVAFRSIRELE